MKSASAIVGIGQTEYSWHSGRSETALAVEAISQALSDAGLAAQEVDGVVRASIDSTSPFQIAAALGLKSLDFTADDANGGSFAAGLLRQADNALRSGQARVVVGFRALNGRSGRRFGRPASEAIEPQTTPPVIRAHGPSPIGGEFSGPYGLVAPAQIFALWANAYLQRYNLGREKLEKALETVVLRQHTYANRNPLAQLYTKPFSAEDYRQSPVVAEPLRRADICLETDGACAFVVVSSERARNLPRPPVYISGTIQALVPGYEKLFLEEEALPPRPPENLVKNWLSSLGLQPTDLDVLGCYDANAFNLVCDVESLGLCDYGEGADWLLEPGVPLNTGGGHLAEAYLQGMGQVLEVVRQLRGTAYNQVPGAGLGLLGGSALGALALLSKEASL